MRETAWTRTPPTGWTDFMDQVDASEAESMTALMMTSQQHQELMPTTIAIFSDQDVVPRLARTPDTRSRLNASDQCSPEGAVHAGRVHASPISQFKVNSGGKDPDGNCGDGGDGGGDNSPRPLKDPWLNGRPNYAGGTGGGPSDGGGRRGDDSFVSGSEGNGSGPPDPPGHGASEGDGHGDDGHRDGDGRKNYRVWDDARPTYSSQPKPPTIDKHKRAIPKLEIGLDWEELPPATVNQTFQSWVTQVQKSVGTWCRQAYTMFVTSMDSARVEHEKWLEMLPEEQAAMEGTYILGTVNRVPQAPDTITAHMRVD
eukprot:4864374-Amphidinium_carterae.5